MLIVRSPLLPVIIVALFALFASAALADDFTPPCTKPFLPGKAVAIDSRCGTKGTGGDEADQNEAKNNFCAKGPLMALTFDRLGTLQADVVKNKKINFGDLGNHGAHGPTKDRAPLRTLGEGKRVQLKGFVLIARQEKGESVNCGHDFDHEPEKNPFHDIHISLVGTKELASSTDETQKDAIECQSVVAEMTPHFRPSGWTAGGVNKVAKKHLLVRVTGHLFFDSSHVPCASGKPVRSNPKRFSLWEIHPIYKFEVCIADCDAEGTWQTLGQWLTNNP